MRTQNWTPDTCECKVEETLEDDGTFISAKALNKCPAHVTVLDDDLYGVLYSNVDGENKVKNQVEGYLLGMAGTQFGLQEEITDDEGRKSTRWKKGIKYDWSFSGDGKNRKFHIKVKGFDFTPDQKALIKNDCDQKFGKDKVEI